MGGRGERLATSILNGRKRVYALDYPARGTDTSDDERIETGGSMTFHSGDRDDGESF